MIRRPHGRYSWRGYATCGGVLAGVPALLAAAVLGAGRTHAATPSADPATMWLTAADGRLVRANALVAPSPAQIVQDLSFPAARDGLRLFPVPGALVTATGDGALSRIDTRTLRTVAAAPATDGTVAAGGGRLFRVRAETVTTLDAASLRETTTAKVGPVSGWATAPGAIFAATTDGAVTRLDGSGAERVRAPGGAPLLLASTADGVAGYDGAGVVLFRTAGGRSTVASLAAGSARALAASPGGRAFAVLAGSSLVVSASGRRLSRDLPFAAGPPVIDGDVVYLPDGAAGVLHRFRMTNGLPEAPALRFGTPDRLDLDVHRSPQFVWFDDVRGPVAWAVHDGQPQKIIKYAVRAAPHSRPAPTPTPTVASSSPSPPPTVASSSPSPPPTSPATRDPATTATPSPSPSRSHSRTPTGSPSPSGDPLERCGGKPTALDVQHPTATGKDPKIDVDVCERARGGDRYWIVSRSEGLWFAKLEIHGSGPYTVQLLHGSGTPGQHRDFLIVAGRTVAGRQWLSDNLAADVSDTPFDRDNLAPGVDIVSDAVPTTS